MSELTTAQAIDMVIIIINQLSDEVGRLERLLSEISGIATVSWGDSTPDPTDASTQIFGVLELWKPSEATRKGYWLSDETYLPFPCWSIEGKYVTGWAEPHFTSLEEAGIAASLQSKNESHPVEIYRWDNEYRRVYISRVYPGDKAERA